MEVLTILVKVAFTLINVFKTMVKYRPLISRTQLSHHLNLKSIFIEFQIVDESRKKSKLNCLTQMTLIYYPLI
jgi:hypothetical protein